MATVNFIRYTKQSAGALGGVAGYVTQKSKTWDKASGRQLVSGQNCSPQFACREFQATRAAWRKESPVWFYHYTQSFHPDEAVDESTAHKLAQEFAAQAWPDSEVLIATHTDASHTHSHFIVNAVCRETGKMLRQGPGTLARLRQISDKLCQAYGLTVLPAQKPRTQGMTGREYRSAAKGESWKFQTMNAIDRCMKRATTREKFIREMERLGYGVRWEQGRQNITYTHPSGKKVRDRKLHEKKYWKEKMEHEFYIRQQIIVGGIEAAQYAARDSNSAGREPADTDRSNACITGDASHRGGVARAAGGAQCDVSFDIGLDQKPRFPANGFAPEGTGTDSKGCGSDSASDGEGTPEERTGWEEEREALLLSMAESQSPSSVSGLAFSAHDFGRVVGAVAQLGHAVERTQSPAYVTRPYSERKALRREREMKIAMGHRPDDHEEGQGPTLSL